MRHFSFHWLIYSFPFKYENPPLPHLYFMQHFSFSANWNCKRSNTYGPESWLLSNQSDLDPFLFLFSLCISNRWKIDSFRSQAYFSAKCWEDKPTSAILSCQQMKSTIFWAPSPVPNSELTSRIIIWHFLCMILWISNFHLRRNYYLIENFFRKVYVFVLYSENVSGGRNRMILSKL